MRGIGTKDSDRVLGCYRFHYVTAVFCFLYYCFTPAVAIEEATHVNHSNLYSSFMHRNASLQSYFAPTLWHERTQVQIAEQPYGKLSREDKDGRLKGVSVVA